MLVRKTKWGRLLETRAVRLMVSKVLQGGVLPVQRGRTWDGEKLDGREGSAVPPRFQAQWLYFLLDFKLASCSICWRKSFCCNLLDHILWNLNKGVTPPAHFKKITYKHPAKKSPLLTVSVDVLLLSCLTINMIPPAFPTSSWMPAGGKKKKEKDQELKVARKK